ncbi:hypothetical protein FVB32_16255 [Flagellimonas hymeniacidonis]|uniref:START domain-containing protein n=1 Tax=Flagellimonas hymeniacidonis TaxID=2603628 RepID=A0A5C8V4V7_9FLAO|nr:hypothetical protein [Flagellimonas hymeniacidonis]TXN36109.1 hypothetical protein FVB32_16255 [Flagellimonas hymeniacidonis]
MNNKSISTPCFNFVLFAMLIVISLQSCVSPRDASIREWEKHEWQLVKVDKNDEPTWTIYKRKLVGTNFLEYKIEGDIKSSPQACISAFRRDIHNQADNLKNKKYPTYEIVDESKDSLLTYAIHNEPFPFKDTEMSVRYHFSRDIESKVEEVKWKEAWDENSVPPLSKKLSRVQTFRGAWNFSPVSINHCKAVNIIQFNPKKMPNWLVQPMVANFLKKGLEDIREMTSE